MEAFLKMGQFKTCYQFGTRYHMLYSSVQEMFHHSTIRIIRRGLFNQVFQNSGPRVTVTIQDSSFIQQGYQVTQDLLRRQQR